MQSKCICIIPARGGSKRIPRKNIKEFCGIPMLAHSIQIAKKSGIFDAILVSTEDSEISKIAIDYGAGVICRPTHLSDDYTGTREVILHAIESLPTFFAMGEVGDSDKSLDATQIWVCCLYATAPLLDFHTLQSALQRAKEEAQGCYCFSAVEYDYSPFRAFSIQEGKNAMLFKDHFKKRSQDLEKIYHDAGQFYFATAQTWWNRENIFEDSISIVLPPMRVQDIDTLEDWKLAELKFKCLNQDC